MEKFEVTGWTDYDSPGYRNLSLELMEKRGKILRKYPVPTREEAEADPGIIGRRMASVEKEMERYRAENSGEENALALMRDAVVEAVRKGNYHFTGEYHQAGDYGCPVINGEFIYCASMREWGSIMADAYPDEDYSLQDGDGRTGYRYCKWAWRNDEPKVYPKHDAYDEGAKTKLEREEK